MSKKTEFFEMIEKMRSILTEIKKELPETLSTPKEIDEASYCSLSDEFGNSLYLSFSETNKDLLLEVASKIFSSNRYKQSEMFVANEKTVLKIFNFLQVCLKKEVKDDDDKLCNENNCPLPDSDAWKKELLEWINMNWSAKFGSTISYVNRDDLEQQIQEM